jgi:hypothetical protein
MNELCYQNFIIDIRGIQASTIGTLASMANEYLGRKNVINLFVVWVIQYEIRSYKHWGPVSNSFLSRENKWG